MKIELHARFRKRAAKLSEGERGLVAATLSELQAGFGHPHLHSGLGIRRLRKDLFECRAGLQKQLIFFVEHGTLTAYDIMTHDEIRGWLRSF